MKTEIFNDNSGNLFTIIEIKPIISIFKLKQAYMCSFKYGKNIYNLDKVSFKASSIDKLIKKCSDFLGCDVKENYLSIK